MCKEAFFFFTILRIQWPKYHSPNSGKAPTDIKDAFYLIQVCRILLLSINMSYVHGLIPRSAEQTHGVAKNGSGEN